MGVRNRALGALLGGMVLLGSVGVATAATSRVKAKGDKWKPLHTYIGRNDSVRWTNPTNKVHDLKAYGGGWSFSKILDPGEKAARRFKQRGTFKYRCVRHSAIVSGKCQGMCGLIHVT
ncbi:MAG: cupredoxin domain-containing protein [Actinomycetota bacterium]